MKLAAQELGTLNDWKEVLGVKNEGEAMAMKYAYRNSQTKQICMTQVGRETYTREKKKSLVEIKANLDKTACQEIVRLLTEYKAREGNKAMAGMWLEMIATMKLKEEAETQEVPPCL